jgi:hypothetical protein
LATLAVVVIDVRVNGFDERALTAAVRRGTFVGAVFVRQLRWLIAGVSVAPQFVVQMDDTFEWPGGGFRRRWCRHAPASLQLGEHRLNVRAQLLQTRGVRLQLLHRLLMHQTQRMSFAIECLFECSDPVIDVSAGRRVRVRLPLMKGEAESIQLRLEARQALFETGVVLMHH